jgi:hypothetical protein
MAEQGGTTVLPSQKLRAELPGPNHGKENDAVEGAYPAEESMEAFIKAQQEWNSVADTNAQLLSSDPDGLQHHSAEDEAGQDKEHAAGGCCHRGGDELGRERVFAEGMLLVDRLEESGSGTRQAQEERARKQPSQNQHGIPESVTSGPPELRCPDPRAVVPLRLWHTAVLIARRSYRVIDDTRP